MKKKLPLPEHYTVTIQWDDTDNCFVGRVPALPGCIACGETREEVIREIKPMIQDILEVMDECSDPLPEPDALIGDIQRMLPIINVSKLARAAKVNRNTLVTRLRRQASFPKEEALRIRNAIAELAV